MTNKLKLPGTIICIVLMTFLCSNAKAQQTSEEMINLLISKHLITQTEADSVRAVIAIKAQDDKAKQKKFNITSGKALTLNGYTQVRFQSLQEPTKKDGFDIRRARLDLKGAISEKWDYRMQLDFATSPKILDATIGFKAGDYFKVTAGQFKVPFSMENLTASNKLESIDRSQAVEALVARGKDVIGNHNGRDIGLQLAGSVFRINDIYLLDYAVGVFDGAGINATDNNENKDIAGRLLFHPVKGFDIGGSYYNGFDNWTIGTPAVAKNQLRRRIGGEMSYTQSDFSLKGEFIQGKDAGVDRSGWYAQAGYYFIPKKFQLVLKYDTYDPDMDKDKNISTNYVTCLSYYFNDFTRLQGSFTYRDEEGTRINNDVIAVQLQIGF
jgi:phosphate-selective porin OprO and OprP